MGRLVRVVLYAIVVLILYFWVVSLLKSYKQNQELKNAGKDMVKDTVLQEIQDTTFLEEKAVYEDSFDSTGEQVYEKIDKTIEKLAENSSKEDKQNITEKPETKPVIKPVENQTSKASGSQGKYMVIAGSFIKEENARDQLKKLKSLGYQKAEIKIFISSEYHSVIVSRHTVPAEAEKVVQDLKKKGVESFVKEKRD